jgi:hypothetical protein
VFVSISLLLTGTQSCLKKTHTHLKNIFVGINVHKNQLDKTLVFIKEIQACVRVGGRTGLYLFGYAFVLSLRNSTKLTCLFPKRLTCTC